MHARAPIRLHTYNRMKRKESYNNLIYSLNSFEGNCISWNWKKANVSINLLVYRVGVYIDCKVSCKLEEGRQRARARNREPAATSGRLVLRINFRVNNTQYVYNCTCTEGDTSSQTEIGMEWNGMSCLPRYPPPPQCRRHHHHQYRNHHHPKPSCCC